MSDHTTTTIEYRYQDSDGNSTVLSASFDGVITPAEEALIRGNLLPDDQFDPDVVGLDTAAWGPVHDEDSRTWTLHGIYPSGEDEADLDGRTIDEFAAEIAEAVWEDVDTMRERLEEAQTTTAERDAQALNVIAHWLRDPAWGVGMLEDITEQVRRTGRKIENYPGDPETWGRH